MQFRSSWIDRAGWKMARQDHFEIVPLRRNNPQQPGMKSLGWWRVSETKGTFAIGKRYHVNTHPLGAIPPTFVVHLIRCANFSWNVNHLLSFKIGLLPQHNMIILSSVFFPYHICCFMRLKHYDQQAANRQQTFSRKVEVGSWAPRLAFSPTCWGNPAGKKLSEKNGTPKKGGANWKKTRTCLHFRRIFGWLKYVDVPLGVGNWYFESLMRRLVPCLVY